MIIILNSSFKKLVLLTLFIPYSFIIKGMEAPPQPIDLFQKNQGSPKPKEDLLKQGAELFEDAVNKNDLNAVKDLVEQPLSFDYLIFPNVFHFVAERGNKEIFQYLVHTAQQRNPSYRKKNHLILLKPYNKSTPFENAVSHAPTHFVAWLVETYKLNPSLLNPSGYSALHTAAGLGRLDTLRYFIQTLGKDPRVLSAKGESLLHAAANHPHNEPVFSYLIDSCKLSPDQTIPDEIFPDIPAMTAAKAGNVSAVSYLLSRKPLDTLTPDQIEDLLAWAVKAPSNKVLSFLVEEKKLNVKQLSRRTGGTLLHEAAFAGALENVRLLTEHYNIDPNAPSTVGTPLFWAAFHGQDHVIQYLAEHGAQLDAICDAKDGVKKITIAHAGIHCLPLIKYLAQKAPHVLEIPNEDGHPCAICFFERRRSNRTVFA